MSITANCDDCKGEFFVEMQSGEIGKHNGEVVTKHFFVCGHCGKEYPAFFETPKIKVLKHKLNVLKGQLQRAQTQVEASKIIRKQARISDEILDISAGIKKALL